MNNSEFVGLYTKKNIDDSVTSFSNEIGFSLIRNYPESTPYHKDGKKMFIKVAIVRGKLFYSVDMTKPEKEGEDGSIGYIITEGEEYKKKITNFFSDDQEPFIFDENKRKIIFKPKNREFTVDEFVEILADNHLSDRLFFKRILNSAADKILKLVFWLSDKNYDKIRVSIDKFHFNRDNQPIEEEEKTAEPFFKYFYISKNTIFALLLITFIVAVLAVILPVKICLDKIWPFGEFSLSNPFVVLFLFLILFTCEKLSVWLNRKIHNFFEKENVFKKKDSNFIERLHNYQYNNRFKLRLK